MKLPLRARITAWYFAVLVVAFASFAWIGDLGFQHSIETTVNDASGANLESIQRVLARTAPKGDAKVKEELNELGGVWEGAALLEVSDSDGKIIFQSKPFKKPFGTVPPITKVKSLSTLSTLTVCSTASPLGLPRSTAKLFGFGPPFQIRQRPRQRRHC